MFSELIMKEIELAGDKFWLTVPPTTTFRELIQAIQAKEIHAPHRMCGEAGVATFHHKRQKNGIEVLCYKEVKHTEKLVTNDFGHGMPDNPHVFSNLEMYFRPCLIPVNRDGLYDTTFSKEAADGAIFQGGYLQVTTITKDGDTGSSTHGNRCDPRVQDNGNFRVKVVHGSALSIVNDWEGTGDPEPPLEWFFFHGILICTYNPCWAQTTDLFNHGLLPRL